MFPRLFEIRILLIDDRTNEQLLQENIRHIRFNICLIRYDSTVKYLLYIHVYIYISLSVYFVLYYKNLFCAYVHSTRMNIKSITNKLWIQQIFIKFSNTLFPTKLDLTSMCIQNRERKMAILVLSRVIDMFHEKQEKFNTFVKQLYKWRCFLVFFFVVSSFLFFHTMYVYITYIPKNHGNFSFSSYSSFANATKFTHS